MTGWVRSSHCAAGDCVEAKLGAAEFGCVHLRLQQEAGRTVWQECVSVAEWDAFIAGVKDGQFDHLGDTP